MTHRLALAIALALTCAAIAHAAPARVHELRLSTGPHPPGDAPDVVAHVASRLDATRPLELVVFLHGFDCCARSLVGSEPVACRSGEPPHRAWDLAAIHERSGAGSILVVPQLAYKARTSQGHRFTRRGSFDAMVGELLAGPLRAELGPKTLADVRGVTLVAHSGGYGALVPILRDETRQLKVHSVVMLDALYAGWSELAHWLLATPDARLVSLHTAQADTVQGNENLARLVRERAPQRELHGSVEDSVAAAPVLIARVKTAHGAIPGVHLADVLRGLSRARR
jgi:hypothetical protein